MSIKRAIASIFVASLASGVMPDGPWYRECGAFVLTAISISIWPGCLSCFLVARVKPSEAAS